MVTDGGRISEDVVNLNCLCVETAISAVGFF